ncbi:LysE family translocator [Paenibacillus puerhi]|uniref:LysE family translocator n=1 Tax=Paenibacillus puerhi TaxID=2692622 RepID=UPI00135C79CE|nr:LysE family transporter [Paenibacillus puerhi]
MLSTFLTYIVLGLSMSAPIGPINAAQLDQGLRYGFWHAWAVGFGGLFADILYMALVYMGVAHVIETPLAQLGLWLFGSVVLFYMGAEALLAAGKPVEASGHGESSIRRSLATGFLMSVSSPLTILFWLGIFGSVLAKTFSTLDTQSLLLHSAAIVFGIVLWDVVMALAASVFRKRLSARAIFVISVVSGSSLIAYALYFSLTAARVIFG